MTYQDFRNTYKFMLKTYPGTWDLYEDEEKPYITATKTEYTKSGSRWKEGKTTTQTMTFVNYSNVVDAVQFFRNLGGREIVKLSYTRKGYIPTTIHSISPDRTNKSVWHFSF